MAEYFYFKNHTQPKMIHILSVYKEASMWAEGVKLAQKRGEGKISPNSGPFLERRRVLPSLVEVVFGRRPVKMNTRRVCGQRKVFLP